LRFALQSFFIANKLLEFPLQLISVEKMIKISHMGKKPFNQFSTIIVVGCGFAAQLLFAAKKID
jgi:hypothetical protein